MVATALAGAVLGFLFGAIIGSFLATIVVRWPNGQSATVGRSRCDRCGRTIAARDLVPLISALLRRGRCRHCGARIDPLHWRIELIAAVIGASALAASPDLQGVAVGLFGLLLLPLAVLDWRHFWLPDRLVLALAVAGLPGGAALGVALPDQLIGGLAGFASLWLVAEGYRRLRGRTGLGQGDPKLMGAIGLWLGWQWLAPLLAAAAGAGLVLAVAGRRKASDPFPFGTMLALTAWPLGLVVLG